MKTLKSAPKVNFGAILKSSVNQFFLQTGIHGCVFIGQQHTSKYAWAFIVLSFLSVGICFVVWSSDYVETNNVITAADSVSSPISNYIFPAITICNLNKVSLKKAQDFSKQINKLPNINESYVLTLLHHFMDILYLHYDKQNEQYYEDLQALLDVNNMTTDEVFMAIRSECKDLLRNCIWKGWITRCDEMFEESASVQGFCCSFNYLGVRNHNFYGPRSSRDRSKPKKMSACGYRSGLRLVMNNLPEDYFMSDTKAYGTNVLIHYSYDYPHNDVSSVLIPMTMQTFISIIPTSTYATKDINALPISQRNCLFTNEKTLNYFTNYSYVNCLQECRIAIMQKLCGCVPLFYWNIKGLNEIESPRMCGIKEAQCVNKHTKQRILTNSRFTFESEDLSKFCECLPTCESNSYRIETSSTKFARTHSIKDIKFYAGSAKHNSNVINVYYRDLLAIRYRTDINLKWYMKFAWFGGLLSLFVGFNIISVFELLYYFTIKLVIDYFFEKKSTDSKIQKRNTIHPLPAATKSKEIPTLSLTTKEKLNLKILPTIEGNFLKKSTVPPITKLYTLKKTNNPWYFE